MIRKGAAAEGGTSARGSINKGDGANRNGRHLASQGGAR